MAGLPFFQLPFWDTSPFWCCLVLIPTFNSLFGIRNIARPGIKARVKSFNSLFGIRSGSLASSTAASTDFQLPFWDTQSECRFLPSSYMLSTPFLGYGLALPPRGVEGYFQLPFWDTVSGPLRILDAHFTFNSLFGIPDLQPVYRIVYALSTPFLGYSSAICPSSSIPPSTFNSLFGIPDAEIEGSARLV